MSGPRIFLFFVTLVGLLGWWALVGDEDADLKRGLEETEIAFEQLEAELRAMDEAYIPLTRRGFMLTLKGQHDRLRSGLAELRARRVHLENDESLERLERLPAFREIAEEANELFTHARSLHARTKARYEFQVESSPLLNRCRSMRDLLGATKLEDPGLRARRDSLGGTFAVLEQGAKTADGVLATNLSQGVSLGKTNLKSLERLAEDQEGLLTELGVEIPVAPSP